MMLPYLILLLLVIVHLVPLCFCVSVSSSSPLDYESLRREYVLSSSSSSNACPCVNTSLCHPVTVVHRKELFIFQVSTDDWISYSWDVLTTIAVATPSLVIDPTLYCYAHARDVRLVYLADYPSNQLSNKTNQLVWVNQWVDLVMTNNLDGINVDFESSLPAGDPGINQYTSLCSLLSMSLRSSCPSCQLSVDVAWSPNCIDGRCYDVLSISKVVDLLFIMSYDLRSQIYDMKDCVASANSPIRLVYEGVMNYTLLGISSDQLVLGVPWYCYDYPCLPNTPFNATVCPIHPVPFRGAPCSDAGGTQRVFATCIDLLSSSANTGRVWNPEYATPYFNYINEDDKLIHQVWFDDLESLAYKYRLVHEVNLRGVGQWAADFLNYTQPINPLTTRMWQEINGAVRTTDKHKTDREQ